MSENLIKPYEISVWEDELIVEKDQQGNVTNTYYKENKIAIIGSNTMSGLNRVYEPVFTEKNNGEKTLTFSLKYQYFDPYIGATVVNPFASYLINERKVKLYYGDKWYDFIIKDHSESSDGLTWTYSATDAFVNELSKNGYNKEFDIELGNNLNTAVELAKITLEGTDWTVDEENSSVGQQEISEAIYNATLESTEGITIVDADTGEIVQVSTGSIFVFYNYIANKDGNFVYFITQEDNPNNYEVDDNNTIRAKNYRIETSLIYDEDNEGNNKEFRNSNGTTIISIENISVTYHAYRKVYNQLTTYDPVMKRTVNRYIVEDGDQTNDKKQEIYQYTDYQYSTSDIVVNYITNGEDFNIFNDGSLQGWTNISDFIVDNNEATIDYPQVSLATYPEISANTNLSSLASYTQVEGYIEIKFPTAFDNYRSGICNTGIEDSAPILNSISKGQKFLFRWRGAKSNSKHGSLTDMEMNDLRVVVAKYNKSDDTKSGKYYNIVDTNNIILDFNPSNTENNNRVPLNNYIVGGELIDPVSGETDKYKHFTKDGVTQEPSTKYIYTYNGNDYTWNATNLWYERKPNTFFNYYYMVATAKCGITSAELTNPSTNIGIFIYANSNANQYYYLQDVQLTKLYGDPAEPSSIVTLGNVPTVNIIETNYFYKAPEISAAAESVELYLSKETLALDLGCDENLIKPIYNVNSTKYLSITESNSNCYNILQTIAETFECWIELNVEHDFDTGAIKLINGKPNKKVILREYIGKDNLAGFKYGINLNSIERTVNSEEIVTKLYVTPAQSEYTDTGSVAIGYANANPSKEEYILNFDYYYKQGLISNREDAEQDILSINDRLQTLNKEIESYEKSRRYYEESLNKLNSQRNVYKSLIDEAKNKVNEGKNDFAQLTGHEYDYYVETQTIVTDLYYFNTTDTEVYRYKDYYEKKDGEYKLVSNPKSNPSESPAYYEYLPVLANNNTIVDIIAKIYTNSYMINNYVGLAMNTEDMYKLVRHTLRGSEDFTFTVGLRDGILKLVLSDYVVPFSFRVGTRPYTTDINTKVFEVPTGTITNIQASGYRVLNSKGNVVTSIVPNENKLQTFTLKAIDVQLGIEDEINNRLEQKKLLIETFYKKYSRFIQEGTWSSTDYVDSNLYYLDALQVSKTSAEPQVTYTINVVEISELEGFKDYNFEVGDKTYIEDVEFFGWGEIGGIRTPAKEEVIVSQIEWHLEEPENNVITVQNYKTRFEDLFQRINATVQTVQYNEVTYAKTSSLMDAYGMLSQSVLLESLNNISGQKHTLTSDGSIVINGDRIDIIDLHNKNKLMRLESTGLKITSDGGQTWTTAIDGNGINLGVLRSDLINTDEIIIGSRKNPSFRWDKAGISAYKRDKANNVYSLNTYVRFDRFGLYGIADDREAFIANSLDEVKTKASFAVTWDGFFIKNSYEGGGRVEITSDNDFRVLNDPLNEGNFQEKIKIGALEWGEGITSPTAQGATALPTLYGIRIKNNLQQTVMQTDDEGNIHIQGDITATTGHIGGMIVDNDKLSMNTIVLEPGVGIYSTVTTNGNRMFSISDVDGSAVFRYIEALGGKLGNLNVINTLIVGDNTHSGLIKSNNYIADVSGWMINSAGYAEFSNAKVRGHIEAQTGDFTGWVAVGDRNQNALTNPWIVISGGATSAAAEAYGSKAIIKTSNYSDGASYGWMINSDGDAVFNNITARGAIKTAVFEYAEIQAVGGIFIFRPSSTIKFARFGDPTKNAQESANDLIVKVEKPLLFAKIVYELTNDTTVQTGKTYYRKTNYGYEEVKNPSGNPKSLEYYECISELHNSWCKISNYISDGIPADSTIQNILLTNGLTHVYRISKVNPSTSEITLEGAARFVSDVKQNDEDEDQVLKQLEGGALVDMGRLDGTTNYGIGVNSSDNTANLPARAISLFETRINPNESLRVTYDYKGILGTLPILSADKAKDSLYNVYMAGTQGIYTDNMYIGDNQQYLAFYKDNNGYKHLKISAREIIFSYDEDTGKEITWEDKINSVEADSFQVTVHSTIGTSLVGGQGRGALFARPVRNGVDVDSIPMDIEAGDTLPSNPDEGDCFILLSGTGINGTATLKIYNGSDWVERQPQCTYAWTYRDANNDIITNHAPASSGQCVYIDGDLITSKLTAEVKVDLID